jgi:hypothetical protein
VCSKKRSNVTETTKAIDKRGVWNSGIVLVGGDELVEGANGGRYKHIVMDARNNRFNDSMITKLKVAMRTRISPLNQNQAVGI